MGDDCGINHNVEFIQKDTRFDNTLLFRELILNKFIGMTLLADPLFDMVG